MVTWFCTCLVVIVLLWQDVDSRPEPLSDGYHDGGSQDTAISYEGG